MGSFIGELRYALRQFWVARVFTITAVLTLALVAFVFAGGGSRGDRLPKDRLTDEQAKARPGSAPQRPDLSAIVGGNE